MTFSRKAWTRKQNRLRSDHHLNVLMKCNLKFQYYFLNINFTLSLLSIDDTFLFDSYRKFRNKLPVGVNQFWVSFHVQQNPTTYISMFTLPKSFLIDFSVVHFEIVRKFWAKKLSDHLDMRSESLRSCSKMNSIWTQK